MASVICDDLDLCVDCTMMIANGEGSPEHAEAMEAAWGEDSVHLVMTCNGDDFDCSFSWVSCDGCGSRLGGDRHKGALVK